MTEIGIFLQPVHAPSKDITEGLEQDRELIIMADRLGFKECWVGEHISATVEPITDPLIFCASLIDATKQIKMGTGVMCLPQQHPATAAARIAMFDHLARGRFQLGIGPGGLSSDFEVFGLGDARTRGEMMVESLQMMQQIWMDEPPYHLKGKYWDIKLEDMSRRNIGVGVFAKPYQKPHPPVAVSLMSPQSETAYTAGLHGWIPISGASLVQPRNVATHWDRYAAGAEKAGRQPDRSIWRVARSVWVAESDQEAEEYLARDPGPFQFYFNHVISSFKMRDTLHYIRPDGREHDESVTWLDITRSQVAYGSPKTVLEKLVALSDQLGPFGYLLLTAVEWDDVDLGKRSVQLFADEVAPKLKQHLTSRLRAIA